jgi:hypothetical protein
MSPEILQGSDRFIDERLIVQLNSQPVATHDSQLQDFNSMLRGDRSQTPQIAGFQR